MDNKTFERVQARVEEDKERQDLFCAYNDMDVMKWTPPSSLLKDWVRIRVNTEAHDALKTMANIFDTYNPKWDIMPLGESDTERADSLEVWLEYHMQKANQNGAGSPFRKGLHNSGKYNRVIYHVDYLPYWLDKDKNKWTHEQKAAYRNGPFCVEAVDPRSFYFEIGKYGLRWVAQISNIDGQDIIDHWGVYEGESDEGKQIASGLKKIRNVMDEDESDFVYLDFTSHEQRTVAAWRTSREGISDFCDLSFEDAIIILDGENKINFIPYAVAEGDSDALLHSMHVGGIWENQNMIETIVDSSVLRRAFFPLLKHTSATGEDLDISYDGAQDVVEQKMGEQTEVLMPPPIDTGLQQLAQINSQRLGQSAGIKNLGMQDIAGNVQFSTVQAQIQLQLTSLQPYKRTDEKALIQAAYIMFQWIEKTDSTEIAYRSENRVKSDSQFVGEGITVSVGDFDPDAMIITCNLLSAAPTDKQQLVNMIATLKQAGAQIGWTDAIESLQLGNPQQLKKVWMAEQIEGAALQNFVAELQSQLRVKEQAQILQVQMQMQQAQAAAAAPPPQEGTPSQGDAISPSGSGYDTGSGGQPPMMATPGLTRNNVRNPG